MNSRKKECVAMLLAGGQGTRLYSLTKDIAKPAVSYGGKYRIIDFPLSNCINSGIDTIGVLTQYQPFALNQYIGNGQPWDLDRLNGGVFVLPPYMKSKNSDWYKGTANAIYQNIAFIDKFSPEYVLVLSGDHIYKMDYADMLSEHKRRGADCTIAVIDVSIEEASRFGIMNTKEDGEIYEFEEKPKKPKSTSASMGIYVFNWDKLRKYLIADEADTKSSNDFGKNIIPDMLADGQKLYAYKFSGYCWKIYARNTAEPPHYTGRDAVISNSLITEGCEIDGDVVNSVISTGAEVCKGANVSHSIVMPGAKVCEGASVAYAIIGAGAVIGSGARVGKEQSDKDGCYDISVVAPAYVVKDGGIVDAGEMVE